GADQLPDQRDDDWAGEHVGPAPVGEPSADVQQDLSDGRQLGAEVFEDRLELRNNEDHDHRDDADGDGDDHRGVDHGADDFLFEPGGFFHEVGETRQDEVEHAARFAGVDHVDVKLVERLGVFGHRVGEGPAAVDFLRDAADDRLE